MFNLIGQLLDRVRFLTNKFPIVSADITDGTIVDADISASAAITPDKFAGQVFSYGLSTSQNNVTGNGTVYTVPFNTALVTHASVSGGIFTAPVAGKYLFVTTVGVASGSAGGTQGIVQIVTTGGSARFDIDPYTNRHKASGVTSVTIAAVFSMALNDTAKVTVQITGDGSDIADVIGGSGFATFAGQRIA